MKTGELSLYLKKSTNTIPLSPIFLVTLHIKMDERIYE